MTNNFRALCAELLDEVVARPLILDRELIARARAALADEPPEPIPPAALPEGYIDPEHSGDDRALLQTFYSACQAEGGTADEVTLQGLRAVLARWGNHEPAPPADGEVAELVRTLTGIAHWRRRGRPGEGDPSPFDIRQADRLDRAAELLQRQAPVPVSVSERPPGPEDCAPWPQPSDNSGWCWMSRTVHGFYGSFAIWEQVSVVHTCREVYAHWLPAHALPVPEADK